MSRDEVLAWRTANRATAAQTVAHFPGLTMDELRAWTREERGLPPSAKKDATPLVAHDGGKVRILTPGRPRPPARPRDDEDPDEWPDPDATVAELVDRALNLRLRALARVSSVDWNHQQHIATTAGKLIETRAALIAIEAGDTPKAIETLTEATDVAAEVEKRRRAVEAG